MSLMDRRVSDEERDALNVKSVLGPRLTGTVKENKNIFDRLVEFLVAHYNAVIEELTEPAAAAEIGAELADVTEKTVQGVLNKHDTDIKNRYTKAETEALLGEDTKDLLESFDINLSTGVITVIKKDGTTQSWDTALEKIPASFAFVEDGGSYYLQVTNEDGTASRTDVTALMNHYDFANSSEVAFTVTGEGPEKRVTATVRANSIGIDKLSLTAVSQLEGYVSGAAQSAAAAESSKLAAAASETASAGAAETASAAAEQAGRDAAAAGVSEREARSFAKGDTNTREGEETDNAEYYAGLAKTAKENAEASKADAQTAKELAEAAKVKAETAQTGAEAAWTGAEAARKAADAAQSAARVARGFADAAKNGAVSAQTAAENSAAAAAESAADLAVAVESASGSETAAAGSAAAAKTEADRAKSEADRASEIVGGDFATKTEVASAADEKVSAHNTASDVHSALFEGKVDKVDGKALSSNDYTAAEKEKLAGMEAGANHYTHPATPGNRHIPAGGASGQMLGWSSDGTAAWQAAPKSINNILDAAGRGSVCMKWGCIASGQYAFASGFNTNASGNYSHAEGLETYATSACSHAEGGYTSAEESNSHAEGYATQALGEASHAEGSDTLTTGYTAHAEGYDTKAKLDHSHAEGIGTIANCIAQHVQGKHNIEDTNDKFAHIVGNGVGPTARSNAHTLDWNGNAWFAGTVKMKSPVTAGEGGARNIYTSTDGALPETAVDGDICIVL